MSGRQLRGSIREINPKASDLPEVGVVILHQENPKMKVKEPIGEMKLSLMSETKVKGVADNTKAKSHLTSPFRVTRSEEGKLQALKKMLSVSSMMIFLRENKMVEINSRMHLPIKKKRGRPKKRNGSNSKLPELLATKNGDSDSVYKRRTRNIQPSKLGDHKEAVEYSESKIDLMSNRRMLRSREVHM